MAVTIDYDALVSMLYRGGTVDRPDLVRNVFDAAAAVVNDYAPAAPDPIADRAVVMLAGYMDDAPFGPRKYDRQGGVATIWDTTRATNALRNSGAAALLTRYKRRRAR